jgi:hypothetical protein
MEFERSLPSYSAEDKEKPLQSQRRSNYRKSHIRTPVHSNGLGEKTPSQIRERGAKVEQTILRDGR